MDPIIRVRISHSEADKLRPTLETWRAAGNATLFCCLGTSFCRDSGDLILELSAVVAPRAIAKKACNIVLKGATQP